MCRFETSFRCVIVAAVGAALLGTGCAGNREPTYPVHGQVFFQGQPIPHALVVFHPVGASHTDTIRPVGKVETDGSFTLSTYGSQDGAPPGDYAVTIEWRTAVKTRSGDYQPGPNRLPDRYSKPSTSGLQVRVEEGSNELQPFHLTK